MMAIEVRRRERRKRHGKTEKGQKKARKIKEKINVFL